MGRIILMVVRLLPFVPGWFYKICAWGKEGDAHSREEKHALLKHIFTRANRAGRVNVICTGVENIPKENGFIFFANHQGFFDGLTLLETCPNPITAVIKKEATSWILVKQVCRLIHAVPLDRSSVKDAVRVIGEVSERVKAGENFIIFPEGTRSRNGNVMGEFKGGTFKSAISAKCPIVPIALIDCYKPFDTKGIKPVTVQIHYLPPIPYEEYQGKRTKELAHLVQSRIQEAIDANIG